MIGRNHLVEIKRIEELSLTVLPPTHHAPLPLMPYPPTESRIASRLNESFATQSPEADITQQGRHFRSVPTGDIGTEEVAIECANYVFLSFPYTGYGGVASNRPTLG